MLSGKVSACFDKICLQFIEMFVSRSVYGIVVAQLLALHRCGPSM
jgi:hypothetical protein